MWRNCEIKKLGHGRKPHTKEIAIVYVHVILITTCVCCADWLVSCMADDDVVEFFSESTNLF